MQIIGITGGLGSGKSTVMQMFRQKGAYCIHTDRIVHELLDTPSPCRDQIIRSFGEDVLTKGRIDRQRLALIVFNDAHKREVLEKILHPHVWRVTQEEIAKAKTSPRTAVVAIEVPLLFEAEWQSRVDHTIVVTALEAQQVERATTAHPWTVEEVRQRMRQQMPLAEKAALADFVIDNSRSRDETRGQVDKLWRHVQSLAHKTP